MQLIGFLSVDNNGDKEQGSSREVHQLTSLFADANSIVVVAHEDDDY